MTTSHEQQSYDELPYLVRAYAQATPDRLATLARLHGLISPRVTSCRVLELGCAVGGNIIPMAHALPESRFVGVDAAAAQIAQGQATIGVIGLHNITLKPVSLLEIDDDWGHFDYIIAHGVYSWVPEAVREHLLKICSNNLAPNGVAYISYNTYPGWRVLGAVRDALLYHTRGARDLRQRATYARSLLDFLATTEGDYTVFPERPMKMAAQFFKEKVDSLGEEGDSYLLHELLEEINEPLYFSEFMGHAQQAGLQYVCEAELSDTLTSAFPTAVAQAISGVATDPIDLGQYMDFLRDQTFRQTLLCHDDVPLDHNLDLNPVLDLWATSRAVPDRESAQDQGEAVSYFRDMKHNVAFATEHPLTTTVLHRLGKAWPQALRIRDLMEGARPSRDVDRGAAPSDSDAQVLAANLARAYSYSKELVNLHSFAPLVATDVGDTPVASPVARFEARYRGSVTNQYHERVPLDPLSQYLLPFLDGSRDQAALQRLLANRPDGGNREETIGVPETESKPLTPEAQLSQVLTKLRDAALLVG